MNNLHYFASFFLVITLQKICDANPDRYGLPDDESFTTKGYDAMVNNRLKNAGTSFGRTSSTLGDNFMRGKSPFDTDSPFRRPGDLPTLGSFFDRNPTFPIPAVTFFPTNFRKRPFAVPENHFDPFSSNPLSGYSESDGSSDGIKDYTRKRKQTRRTSDRKFQSTTQTHVLILSPSGLTPPPSSYQPPSRRPINIPIVGDSSDESSSDDKRKKLKHSLQNVAPLAAAAAAGATAASALAKKPPPTQVRPLDAAAPNSAIAEQPKNDEGHCNWCLRENCNPGGCEEVANFDAKEDAKAINKALKEKDERVIIEILTHRSDKQRKRIKEEYQEYASSLLKEIEKSKLKSKKLLEALLVPRALFFAEELHKAFKDGDDEAMITMLTSLSSCAVKKVGVAYNHRYGKTLVEDIKSSSSFKFEDFLVQLSKGSREAGGLVDQAAAENDAKALTDAGPKKMFESGGIDIFTERSYPQLREIIKKYNIMSKSKNIVKDIKDNTSKNLKNGLLALLHNMEDQPGYFADELEGSLEKLVGNGVENKDMLIRIMRGRCGVDLGDIKNAYPNNHDGKNLVDKIKSKSGMPYKEALESMLKN